MNEAFRRFRKSLAAALKDSSENGTRPPRVHKRMGGCRVKMLEDGPDGQTRLRMKVSSAAEDRSGDIIDQEGFELENFKANPVVPWAHQYSQLPIAKATFVGLVSGDLHMDWEFPTKDLHPVGHTAGELYKNGFLNTSSVGFDPIEWNERESVKSSYWSPSFHFITQELWEASGALIPANPEALIQASAQGIDLAPLNEMAMKLLDDSGQSDPAVRKWVARAYHFTSKAPAVFDMGSALPAFDGTRERTAPALPSTGLDLDKFEGLVKRVERAAYGSDFTAEDAAVRAYCLKNHVRFVSKDLLEKWGPKCGFKIIDDDGFQVTMKTIDLTDPDPTAKNSNEPETASGDDVVLVLIE